MAIRLARNYETIPWTLLENFTDSWSVTTGTTSLSSLYPKSAAQSRLWTPAGNSVLYRYSGFSTTIERLQTIGLWVFVDVSAGGTKGAIRLTTGEGSMANGKSWVWPAPNIREGWNLLVVDRWEDGNAWPAPAAWTTNGTGSFTNTFDRMEFNINTTNVSYYIGGFYYGGRARTKVIFGVDNGAATDSGSAQVRKIYDTIYPKFTGFGWKGYLAVPHINYATNLSVPRTTEMYNSGWDVINHSTTHTNFTTISNAQVDTEIDTMKSYMASNGWTRTLEYGAYPENATNNNIATYLESRGEVCWRGSVGRYSFNQSNFTFPDSILQMPSADASPLTLAQLQNIVKAAMRMGGSVNFYTHGLDTVSGALYMSETVFDQFCDWLRARELEGMLDVVTPKKYIDGLSNMINTI